MSLTILTARPLPARLADTSEGGLSVLAALRSLLVAWIRCALVPDLCRATWWLACCWNRFTTDSQWASTYIHTYKHTYHACVLTCHTCAKVWWDVSARVLVGDADAMWSQTHCNKEREHGHKHSNSKLRLYRKISRSMMHYTNLLTYWG